MKPAKTIMISNEKKTRNVEGIEVLPIRDFLKKLWNGEILK